MSPDGAVAKKSKTEAGFYPQAGYTPTPSDTLPLQIDDASGIVTFTRQQFRYLGAISSSTTRSRRGSSPLHSAVCGNGCSAKRSAPARSRLCPKASCTAPSCSTRQPAALRMRELGADSAAPPRLNTFTTAACASTNDHPAPFVKRPAALSRRCTPPRHHVSHEPRPGHLLSELRWGWHTGETPPVLGGTTGVPLLNC
jgi:hypothetical protein